MVHIINKYSFIYCQYTHSVSQFFCTIHHLMNCIVQTRLRDCDMNLESVQIPHSISSWEWQESLKGRYWSFFSLLSWTLHLILFLGSLSVFELSKRDVRPTWKQQCSLLLESLQVTAFVTFATFLALFMDDFRLACLPTSLDNACQCISLAIMVCPYSDFFVLFLLKTKTALGWGIVHFRHPRSSKKHPCPFVTLLCTS